MKLRVDVLIDVIIGLIIIGAAAYCWVDEYGTQKFIEGQRDGDEFRIYMMTSDTVCDIQFHSREALNSLNRNSTGAFNLSMVELVGDFEHLELNLWDSVEYLFPNELPNETLVNMTRTYQCAEFVELSRKAVLNGTANVSAVREGLSLIYESATEWRANSRFPSEEFLRANAGLQRKCGLLLKHVSG
ncbi:hypothetical protein A3L12_00960 [Thermococcus sp. P6]|uniref:hypothetical protein n=1 Tax=Thermococcus sp. P6 TaxID=122420 RepID=UPI000B5995F3|nr:hypothetical protein [Thermococcus sp. P6]ASJ09966.1 hypothetical protein A3L12_00960 [Thermococcus sp. P6]